MAEWTPIPLATQSYQPRSGVVSLERLVNLYPEIHEGNTKSPVVLRGTPGLSAWNSYGNGPIRGLHYMEPDLYVVSGEALYVVNWHGDEILLGPVLGVGNVHMTDNGTHVGIAANKFLYAANRSEIITLPQQYMNGATYQDGYGIFSEAQSERFWITDTDDMTSINALDFSTADAFADEIMGCISDHRELILMGKTSGEVWHNVGAASFPFLRSQSGFIERGMASSGSLAKALNTVFFEGDDFAVYAMQGYSPKPITTPPIQRKIESVLDPHSGWAFTYSQDGHDYYVLGFSDLTVVYDITTNRWHERKSDGLDRWRVNRYARAWDKQLVGDHSTGDIYELDPETYDENGDLLRREATLPPISKGGRRLAMHELYLDIEMGVGLTSGQGSDPVVMLDWSDDGGKTWSNERTATIGKIGEYTKRCIWTRLGTFRQRTLRFAISDPVNIAILGAFARLELRE